MTRDAFTIVRSAAFPLCAMAVVFAVMLAGCSQGGSSSSSSEQAAEAVDANAERTQDAIAATGEDESLGQMVIDWDDAGDRALVNECLSWVAQAFNYGEWNRVDGETVDAQVHLAVQYIGINDPSAVERGEYTSVSDVGGRAQRHH